MEIIQLCKLVEREHGVRILFAVENGSRAWGMESTNSDYDVRFVFARPLEEYISLSLPRDVIEVTRGDIDLVGFDIFKFLSLLRKSNPSMIEWLFSHIVYEGEQPEELVEWARVESDWKALYEHYRSLCRSNFSKYIEGSSEVSLKKYLYVFRGLVNARYVALHKSIPPIDFSAAMAQVRLPKGVVDELLSVLEKKKSGVELAGSGRLRVLDDYAREFLDYPDEVESRTSDALVLNDYLRSVLL